MAAASGSTRRNLACGWVSSEASVFCFEPHSRMDRANQIAPKGYASSDLAYASLYATERDPNQKLAWVNSVCLLVLVIGVLGARFGSFRPRPVAPMEQAVPAIVEPLPPPQSPSETKPQEQTEQP